MRGAVGTQAPPWRLWEELQLSFQAWWVWGRRVQDQICVFQGHFGCLWEPDQEGMENMSGGHRPRKKLLPASGPRARAASVELGQSEEDAGRGCTGDT